MESAAAADNAVRLAPARPAPVRQVTGGRPGPHLVPALLGCAGLALGAPFWAPLGWLALGSALGLLGLAVAEGVALGRIRPTLHRAQRTAIARGHRQAVPCAITHHAAAPLRLTVRQTWPTVVGGGSDSTSAVVASDTPFDPGFAITGLRRGVALLPLPHVAWTRHGLWERDAALTDPADQPPAELAVMPDLSAVRRLRREIEAHFLRGLGTRLTPRAGQGREFDRLREYVRGDDYRHISWKDAARRGRLIVRDHRLERSQDVMLCVDAGHRMAALVSGGGAGLAERCDHAVDAAVLTAWLADRSEDRVGLLSFAAAVEPGLTPNRGAKHLAAITSYATAIRTAAVATDFKALAAHLRRRLKNRTLVLITTVLPERGDHDDLLTAVRLLAVRHLPLLLVIRDPLLETIAEQLPDAALTTGSQKSSGAEQATARDTLCRTLVAGDLVDGRRQVMRELRDLGALVVETDPGDTGVTAVNAYLDVKRRQLL